MEHNEGNEVAKGTALSKRTKSKTVMGMIAHLHSLQMEKSDHQRWGNKKVPALMDGPTAGRKKE
jgi:hypothetical protein